MYQYEYDINTDSVIMGQNDTTREIPGDSEDN
jgi:hypothetical protein